MPVPILVMSGVPSSVVMLLLDLSRVNLKRLQVGDGAACSIVMGLVISVGSTVNRVETILGCVLLVLRWPTSEPQQASQHSAWCLLVQLLQVKSVLQQALSADRYLMR